MFPLSDDNPRVIVPVITWATIAACVAVFLFQLTLPEQATQLFVYGYGMVPAELFGLGKPYNVPGPPEMATLFTSMFLHGGFLHLGGNMLYLWIFGDNIEAAMGWFRFVIFYILCGLAAALAQALSEPGSVIPMIGASGAISGVLGAYLLLYPRATVRTLIFIIPFVQIVHIPAMVVLGLYALMQVLLVVYTPAGEGGVALWAHIGGFIAGMALIPFMKYRHIPMFQSRLRRGPWG